MSTSQLPAYQLLPTSDDSQADQLQLDLQPISDPNRSVNRQPGRKFLLGVVLLGAVILLFSKLSGYYVRLEPSDFKKDKQDKGNTTMPNVGKYSVG